MSSNRIVAIDYTRAIAIILVVIGHWAYKGMPLWWETVIDVIYTFHMPLFFAMSGYLYMATARRRSYSSFLLGKVKRLFVP